MKLPYFVTTSLGLGGYLWLSNCYMVIVTQLWGVFKIVYSCTGSCTGLICKINGYLCRKKVTLVG